MCWRDDVRTARHCSFCGKDYYGDLGHRGCQAFKKPLQEVKPGEDKTADVEQAAPEAGKSASTK